MRQISKKYSSLQHNWCRNYNYETWIIDLETKLVAPCRQIVLPFSFNLAHFLFASCASPQNSAKHIAARREWWGRVAYSYSKLNFSKHRGVKILIKLEGNCFDNLASNEQGTKCTQRETFQAIYLWMNCDILITWKGIYS